MLRQLRDPDAVRSDASPERHGAGIPVEEGVFVLTEAKDRVGFGWGDAIRGVSAGEELAGEGFAVAEAGG